MRRVVFALLPGIAAVCVILGYVGLKLWQVVELADEAIPAQPTLPTLPMARAQCPFHLAADLRRRIDTTGLYDDQRWIVYRFEGSGGLPEVTVAPAPEEMAEGPGGVCALRIADAPQAPGAAVDWRVGHLLPSVRGLRGRTVILSVAMRADRPVALDSGEIYIYDGVAVNGVPVRTLTTSWQSFALTHAIHDKATVVEVWFRLVFDKGTVRPSTGTIYFAARLESADS